ncbi:MAG: LacI family DNA-binding transcriptional regulator [Lachnospiraceae bacterium]|nr:LacI family DNA-binding transcriptional regulator [Lachnospiraceae bacterium]
MANRVTIQDIADSLGLSRNTVSKAINNTGVLAEATRQKVLARAIEMGYKQFSYMDLDAVQTASRPELPEKNEIALISTWFLNSSHFSAMMLDKFQMEISKRGYSLSMHIARPEDIAAKRLPASLRLENCAAIMCIEVFDPDYAKFICSTGLPLLFIDAPVDPDGDALPADILLMNNTDGIFQFLKLMKKRGITEIGFVGEYFHCRSFFDRYMAFRNGMYLLGMPIREEWCLTEKPDSFFKSLEGNPSENFLFHTIGKKDSLPKVFICANDFVAIDMLHALERHNLHVPEDICLLGFDDSAESRLVTPKLSSVHIHSQILGFAATDLILSRIQNPDLNYRTCSCETNLVLRESTEGMNTEK